MANPNLQSSESQGMNTENNSGHLADPATSLYGARILQAPVELVWRVWTDPEHVARWWGPEGFTNTISRMDVEPGGHWQLVMHGPDGTDYKNHSVFVDIETHKRIVFDHVSGPVFRATIEFQDLGRTTEIRWTMQFKSPEQLREVINVFKADIGLQQNLDKMSLYLSELMRASA